MTKALVIPGNDIIATIDDLLKLSATLLKSGMLPPAIKTPEAAAAIILKGREVGMPAMEAFSLINVIQGKPTIAPQGMMALARRTGELEDFSIEDDGLVAAVTVKRKGNSPLTTTFSMADATDMGLSGKDNWKKQAKVMRQWRAVAANFRLTFPDAIAGMYTPEELGAEVNDEGEFIEAQVHPSVDEEFRDRAILAGHYETPSDDGGSKGEDKSEPEAPMEFIEGVLTYSYKNGTKMVKYGSKWKPAGDQVSLTKEAHKAIMGLFKNEFEAQNHLKKHFKGVATLGVLTWEELCSVVEWKKHGKPDPRWYSDKVEADDLSKNPRYAECLTKYGFTEPLDPKEHDFLVAVLSTSDPLFLSGLLEAGWTFKDNRESLLALAKLVADGKLEYGSEEFTAAVMDAQKKSNT